MTHMSKSNPGKVPQMRKKTNRLHNRACKDVLNFQQSIKNVKIVTVAGNAKAK